MKEDSKLYTDSKN